MKKVLSPIQKIKGGVTTATGFLASSVKAGIKASGNPDVALVVSEKKASAAGCFTKNAVRASSVDWCASHLPSKEIVAIICNAGNANACTGAQGVRDTAQVCDRVGEALGVAATQVLMASTGVIGHPLPVHKIEAVLPDLTKTASSRKGHDFATAIMTTDTCSKESAVRVGSGAGSYVLGGCVKGSGMIHPNMATMLGFITSDAKISPAILNGIVKRVVDRTFNNLTVDGDTSTNDMVLVLANGTSGVSIVGKESVSLFEEALFIVCNDLCAQIAADGEGATKRVEIRVVGGKTFADAKKAAKSIANSLLVKTALFGNDPNWGRILCAIGYSEAHFSDTKMLVSLCGIPVCKGTQPVPFPVERMRKLMAKKLVIIDVDLAVGVAEAISQTCDLTYDYIKINAEYHT